MRLRWTIAGYACAGLIAAYASAVILCAISSAKDAAADWGLPSVVDPRLGGSSPNYEVWVAQLYASVGSTRVTSVWFDANSGMAVRSGIWPDGDPRPHLPAWAPELDPTHHALSTGRMHAAMAVESGWPLPAVRASAYFEAPFPTSVQPVAVDVRLRGGLLLKPPSISIPFHPWGAASVLPLAPIAVGLLTNAAIYTIAIAAVTQLPKAGFRAIRRCRGKCPACGHALAASDPQRCPECGHGYGSA